MSELVENPESKAESREPKVESPIATTQTVSRSSTLDSRQSPGQRAWRRFRRNRLAVGGAIFLIFILLFVLIYPFFSPFQPDQLSDAQFQPPSSTHWFGTDVHGRDLLVRLCYGAQISLLVGTVGALVSLIIGVLWGAIAGYAGGRLDSAMMRFVDVLYSMPAVIFAIVLMTAVEPWLKGWFATIGLPVKIARLVVLFAALGSVSWLTMARIVRGQVLSLRTRPFVEASRVLGAGPMRILARHIIPNVLGVVIVYLTLTVPAIILYESFLSFLGLGVQPPMASWGSLIAEGVGQINPIRIYWWLILFPSAVLVSTLLALNYLGDGLRDAWDVKGGS
ncbi:MAG TPA: ABC transporter permease [Verrucomicrobiae bacterium]|nr:ABC transporter permease [Verrucomicrobiae bacterium]